MSTDGVLLLLYVVCVDGSLARGKAKDCTAVRCALTTTTGISITTQLAAYLNTPSMNTSLLSVSADGHMGSRNVGMKA